MVAGLLCVFTPGALASSTGISSFSGNPATGGLNCNVCHSGGVVPVVTITGPLTVAPGSVNTYTLRIVGGQANQGGLDVSVDLGTLSLAAGESNMQVLNSEITHTAPRQGQGFPPSVVWTFDWTAPAAPATATIYGSGNSTNNSHTSSGDAAASTTLAVSVVGAAGTPGETSDPSALQPLLVTGYDSLTGAITVSFDSGCETDQNNLYYGPLTDVSTWNWTDEVCDVGTAGSTTFTPPAGQSVFFVVVGNKAGAEGSYGRTSTGLERSPISAGSCGETQDLGNTCTP